MNNFYLFVYRHTTSGYRTKVRRVIYMYIDINFLSSVYKYFRYKHSSYFNE